MGSVQGLRFKFKVKVHLIDIELCPLTCNRCKKVMREREKKIKIERQSRERMEENFSLCGRQSWMHRWALLSKWSQVSVITTVLLMSQILPHNLPGV